MPKTDISTLALLVLSTHEDWHLDLLPYIFAESVRVSSLAFSVSTQSDAFIQKETTLLLILYLAAGFLIFSFPAFGFKLFIYAYDNQILHAVKAFLTTSPLVFFPCCPASFSKV